MEAYSDYYHTSLWNSDDLPTGNPGDAAVGHTAALTHLIEDKEIAARAVAIVIGSARRGVVSLCADVAELLKSKRSLERQVSRLTSENDALRHRCSSSSTPPEVCDLEFRSHSANTSGYHSRPAALTVCAVDVASSRPASNPALDDVSTPTLSVSRPRRRHRSVQLPVTAVRTPESAADELSSLREEVRAALRANAAIVTELMNTKRELSQLRATSQSTHLTTEKLCPVCRNENRPSSAPLVRDTPTSGAVSLLGCACRQCFLLRRHGCPRRLLQLTTIRSNEVVRIKDQVILTDGRSGCVKYIGHVDNDSEKDPNAIWLGIEFDGDVGSGDGKLDHKRYFSCRPRHGEFVSINDISKVVSHSVTSPATTYVTDFI